jgi:hypothetical protein
MRIVALEEYFTISALIRMIDPVACRATTPVRVVIDPGITSPRSCGTL